MKHLMSGLVMHI